MFYDRNKDIEIRFSGNLPHMHQDETLQSVTFRLGDSLPQSVCKDLIERKKLFMEKHPQPWDTQTKLMYWKEIGPIEHKYLDNGYGACWLKYPECRQKLIEALAYKDEVNYLIDSYVIMPNHVHLLIQPIGRNKLEDIMHSIKLYSAREINKIVGRKGKFWMKEYFDRMVRNEKDYYRCQRYILANPQFLPDGTFCIYVRDGK